MRAQRDRGVCVGRREEYRLSEVRERLVESLGLQRLVEGRLRREACGLAQREVDERLCAVLLAQSGQTRLGLLVVSYAQKVVNVAEALEQGGARLVRRGRVLLRLFDGASARLVRARDRVGELGGALQLSLRLEIGERLRGEN